jgi:hypothetical protein
MTISFAHESVGMKLVTRGDGCLRCAATAQSLQRTGTKGIYASG